MSVKAISLVWEMECPKQHNGLNFKPGHKFILIAYADHADHAGKSIYPAIATIARKTGYQERNVQYLTHELETMGILIPDGEGPRGTNRWLIPYDEGGAKIAPLQILQGAINQKSLGAIPSGAIPSGAKIAPELKEPEPYISNILETSLQSYDWWEKLKRKIEGATLAYDIETKAITIAGLGKTAEILQARYKNYIKHALVIDKNINSITFTE